MPRLFSKPSALTYLATVVLGVALLVLAFRLWRANLDVPFQNNGDTIVSQLWVLNLLENGWYAYSERAGAPHGQNLNDFPAVEGLNFLLLWGISLGGGNVYQVVNLFYLATYVLAALTALFVLRRLGVGHLPALVGGLLFAFLPYHFLRGESHLFLSAYYLVPLSLLLAFWVLRGELDQSRGRLIFAVVVAALVSSAGVYYAFFGCYFLAAAGCLRACATRQWRPILLAGTLIAVTGIGAGLNAIPAILFRIAEGRNPMVAQRLPAEADLYGLKPAQLVLPRLNHRISRLARLKVKYETAPLRSINESSYASLGFLATIGLLAACLSVLIRREPEGVAPDGRLTDLGILIWCGLALAVIGGVGALFNHFVSPQIRCYNRISIFIGFLALAAFAVLLDRLLAASLTIRARWLAWGVCWLALAFGIWDQTSNADVPPHADNLRQHQALATFTAAVEEQVGTGGMVYQMPFISFPESPNLGRMECYDPFRLLMHSPTLRISHGGVRGRPAGDFLEHLAELPPDTLVEELVRLGYGGIHLDRFGYPEGPEPMESRLRSLLGVEPIVCASGRDVFFSLHSLRQRLQTDEGSKSAAHSPPSSDGQEKRTAQ